MPAFTPVKQSNGNPAVYAKAPIASGPYKVQTINDGTSLTLVRNTYWRKTTVRTAGADKVVYLESQNQSSGQNLVTDTGQSQERSVPSTWAHPTWQPVNRNASAKAASRRRRRDRSST